MNRRTVTQKLDAYSGEPCAFALSGNSADYHRSALSRQRLAGENQYSRSGGGSSCQIALEAIRLPGFWLGFLPGNLPRLMGVLLLNQFASGPSLKSDFVGWLYHFWNGASFGLIYVLVFGTCRRWIGALFGVLLGFGFMLSPVVSALGVGFLGLEFSKGFPVTVTVAHAAFGLALGWLTAEWLGFLESPLAGAIQACSPKRFVAHRPLQ